MATRIETIYVCDFCSDEFDEKSEYKSHLEDHKKVKNVRPGTSVLFIETERDSRGNPVVQHLHGTVIKGDSDKLELLVEKENAERVWVLINEVLKYG